MIDLHVHTTHSDSSLTLKEVLDRAEELGIEVISITDHNVIDAHYELKENPSYVQNFTGEIVSGVELSTSYLGEAIEVLGYGFELEKMQNFIDKHVPTPERNRYNIRSLSLAKFKELGVVFDEIAVKDKPEYSSALRVFYEEFVRHPENDKFLTSVNNKKSFTAFARNEMYNPESRLYIDLSVFRPSLQETIEGIHYAGGIAFLAHTYIYSENIAKNLEKMLDEYSLDGLECYYTTFTEEQTQNLLNICKRRGLLVSGGSDCHGINKKNHDLGIGRGNLNITREIFDNWKTKK